MDDADGKEILLANLSRELVGSETIVFDERSGAIDRVLLNPKDNAGLEQRHIDAISFLLYERLASAGIEYDAIASIPTGGDPYAFGIKRIIGALEGSEMPILRFEKSGPYPVKITDADSVPPDSRIILVDDALVSGMTAAEALDLLAKTSFHVAAAVFAADLERLGHTVLLRRKRHRIVSVFSSTQLRALFRQECARTSQAGDFAKFLR